MLAIKIGFLILCLIFSKLVFSNQFTFQQEFNGIVKGRPTYPIILIFHIDIKGFYIKMIITIINFLENGVAFGCFSMPFFF